VERSYSARRKRSDTVSQGDYELVGKILTRDKIAQTLIEALKPLDYTQALWEGGAIAFNRVDEWSDIDLYLLVDDDRVDRAFLAVEEALKSLSPIKQKYDVPQTPWPGVSQAFYKLENASEYLLIDLAVLKLSSTERFLEPEIHGYAVFHFNKNDKVKLPRLDKDAFIKKLHARLERLKARFEMFNNFVQKEINRGNTIEAMDAYYVITLSTLVEALRMKHSPIHYDFKTRYIHYELPPQVTEKLQELYFVRDEKDLQEKYDKASKWFRKLIPEIDGDNVERLIKR
jgi:hypothetical protein